MKRIEFKLSMPGVNTWNGRWSGEKDNYTIVRKLSDTDVDKLLSGNLRASWLHRWDDGWCARVDARIILKGERLPKSDGFCGYDWMVTNIVLYGATEKPAEAD